MSPEPDLSKMKRLYAGARAAFALYPAPDEIDPMTWDRLQPETRQAYLRLAEVTLRHPADLEAAALALWALEVKPADRPSWKRRRTIGPTGPEMRTARAMVEAAAAGIAGATP